MMNVNLVYQKLGEFVVSFQWLENRFREIGWLILDPKRTEWSPRSLRTESFNELIDKVQKMYFELISRISPEDADERKRAFEGIIRETNLLRLYRNNLIHSAYIELQSGGEVFGLIRSNPKLKEDPTSNKIFWDQEALTEESFESGMKRMADVAIQLNLHYTQLIHWAPFDRAGDARGSTRLD